MRFKRGWNGYGSLSPDGFRVDQCMDRHSRPKSQEFATKQESLAYQQPRKYWHSNERQVQNCVKSLMNKGLQPKADESLEQFALRHADVLEGAE